MSSIATPPVSPSRHRLKLSALITLVLAMALVTLGSLWLVQEQARQLALPTLHNELWQAYQIDNEMNHLLDAAHSLRKGELDSDDLVVRIQVLRSLTQSLERHHLFDFLPESQSITQGTLDQIIGLSRDWDARARWGDPQGVRQLAEEIHQRLPQLLKPMHEVMVASKMSLANKIDAKRQLLHRCFIGLGWTLLGLLLGGALLVSRLVSDYRKARTLSHNLAELNQHLEQRVSDRTAELSEGQALLRQILDASPSDVALISDDGKQVHFVNQRLRQRLELDTSSDFSLSRLFSNAREALHFSEALQARQRLDDWETQLAGAEPYWGVVSGRVLEYHGRPALLIWSYDISLRKQMEQELLVLATTDALTGLNNRHAFLQRAGELFKSAERFDQPCTLLMLDIDHFKAINDNHGHQSGDEVLARLGELLRQVLREVDIIGRLGGEEFAALLTQTDRCDALQVAERLRLSAESLALNGTDGQQLGITLSIGLAERRPAEPLEGVLARADSALYRAKAEGRNRTAQAVD